MCVCVACVCVHVCVYYMGPMSVPYICVCFLSRSLCFNLYGYGLLCVP